MCATAASVSVSASTSTATEQPIRSTCRPRKRLGAYGPLQGPTLTVSYSLSRYKATGRDSAAGFLTPAILNDAPTKFFGPGGLDRTHQLTFSFLTDLPLGLKAAKVCAD